MRDRTKKLARCALLAAAGDVLLLIARLVPAGRLGLLAAAGFPVCAALMLYGAGPAWAVFAVTAAIGLLLMNGASSVGYAAFFGYYPILKSLIERLRGRAVVPYGAKLALYTAVFAAYWLAGRALFEGAYSALPWFAVYAIGAAAFFVYDRVYSLVIRFYIDKIARYIA